MTTTKHQRVIDQSLRKREGLAVAAQRVMGKRTDLPRLQGALSTKRVVLGFLAAVLGWSILLWVLLAQHDQRSLTTEVLSYQLLVVIVALIGGLWPALFTAVLSALTLDLLFIEPHFTVVVGGLRAAGEGLTVDDKSELLDTASQSLDELSTLVTDLLDVSRLEAGVLSISLVPVSPKNVVISALTEIEPKPNAVELHFGHAGAQVLADPVLLQRSIANVLSNALRFSPPAKPVKIETCLTHKLIEIRLIDQGPGIPKDRKSDIFLPFQRLGDTDNTTGLGLGLALSRGLIEAMGGTLMPEDTPGGGLTMVITLPVSETDGESERDD